MDKLTPAQRSKLMGKIKGKNTKPEVALARALWHRGYRYRKHNKTIFGTPDLSFKKTKIAVFVDSEFFHGKSWDDTAKRPKSNAEFWSQKIQRNMARDREVNAYLTRQGWTVLRFWSEDIKKSLPEVMRIIGDAIQEKQRLVQFQDSAVKLPSGNYLQMADWPQAAEPSWSYDSAPKRRKKNR